MERKILVIFFIGVVGLVLGSCASRGTEIDKLIKDLSDENVAVRYNAAKALASQGKDAAPAAPALKETLKDDIPGSSFTPAPDGG